jgi:hypothetical protein
MNKKINSLLKNNNVVELKVFIEKNLSMISDPVTLHLLGDFFLINHYWESAISCYLSRLEINETKWTLMNLGRAYIGLSDFRKGIKYVVDSINMSDVGMTEWKILFLTGARWMFSKAKTKSDYFDSIEAIGAILKNKNINIYEDLNIHKALIRLGISSSTVEERLYLRLKYWYKEPISGYEKISVMVNKLVAQEYVATLGIPLPSVYFCHRDIESLDIKLLPNNFCIKPHNGADSRGVLAVYNGVDKITGNNINKNSSNFKSIVSDFVLNAMFTNEQTKILIEEYMEDDIVPGKIPLDYKVHCYGGRVRFIQVINRNVGERSQSFYSDNWLRLPPIISNYEEGADIPKPSMLSDLINHATLISSNLKQMLRIDFYITSKSVYFGEITTYPAAGKGFTKYGNTLAIQFWELFPDSPNLYEKTNK